MPRFITGDELGNIKIYTKPQSEKNSTIACFDNHLEPTKSKAIQALALHSDPALNETSLLCIQEKIACAHADGSISLHSSSKPENPFLLEKKHEWLETRHKPGQRFVGLKMSDRGTYSCTSNGALRLTDITDEGLRHITTSLPMRLCNWRLSSNQQTFAYGGDEVELSVWDTEKAFSSQPPVDLSAPQKRKRGTDLLPAEIWRAKNVPNDSLSLRQPVHVTSIAYLSPLTSSPSHHLLTGTQHGHVRRYDTRAARRPVADWKGVAKVGGIKLVEKGVAEHESFVSDHGSNLFAIDTRTGGVLYGYHGVSGSITSLSPSPDVLASTSLDRFFRLHSTVPPDSQSDQKGQVLDKIYTKSIPTAVIWDPSYEDEIQTPDDINEDDQVWEGMQDVEDSDNDEIKRDPKSRRVK